MSLLYDNPVTPIAVSYLPLIDPGADTRRWRRETPAGAIELNATGNAGLPYGSAARGVLYYLNARARVDGKPRIFIDRGLTSLMQQICLVDADNVHDQLERLAGLELTTRVGPAEDDHVLGVSPLVDDLRRRKTVGAGSPSITSLQFSSDYFTSLMKRAVPLEANAVMDCASNPLALDLYAWFSGSLSEVPDGEERLLDWQFLQALFGFAEESGPVFHERFSQAVVQVTTACPCACVWVSDAGLCARRSQLNTVT